jgi:hypothetical protein
MAGVDSYCQNAAFEVPYEKDYDAVAGEGPLRVLFTARFATASSAGQSLLSTHPG